MGDRRLPGGRIVATLGSHPGGLARRGRRWYRPAALVLEAPNHLLPAHRYRGIWRKEGLAAGRLPPRYAQPWAGRFEQLVRPVLEGGMTVLDVGSGREPVLTPSTRPPLTYVGMDVSGDELSLAPAGAYDEAEIGDLTERVPSFEGRFDLVVSYQVFEHVSPLALAFDNIHAYLKPGGSLVALFSGRYSPMALINRALSFRLAQRVNQVLVDREPESMFEAHYDGCYASAVRAALRDWQAVEIEPRWEAAAYFDFAWPVFRTYLGIESFLAAGGWEDLATHYFLRAKR